MAAPTYSPYLKFNPTFRYFGREWGVDDMAAFKAALRRRGLSYDRWARNHAPAARVFDPTEQQVYGMVQPQLDAINYERSKAEAAARRRMGDLAGFTQAIMGMLGTISPAVRGAYGEGAETMSAGGRGYGDVLNQNMAANAAKGNSLLDVLGSPQRLEGGDAGGVLAGVAGWLPSEMMKAQGGAYGDMYAQLPKEASFQAQLEMKKLMADAAQTDEDFSSQIMGVLTGLPSLRADLQAQRAEANLAKQKLRLDQLEEEHDYYMKQQALLLSQGRYKLAKQAGARAERAQKRYEYESQGRDFEGNLMPGYAESPNGTVYNMKDFHVDKNGNIVKNKSGSGRRGGASLTPGQKQDALKSIDASEEKINEAMAKALQAEFREYPTGPYKNEKKRRQKVASQVFKQFAYLATFPAAKKRLRALIVAALKGGAASANSGSGGSKSTGTSGSGIDWGG